MNLWNETKSVPITREMVWQAYLKVKKGGKSAGVDLVSMEEFDANRSKYLYSYLFAVAHETASLSSPHQSKNQRYPRKTGESVN